MRFLCSSFCAYSQHIIYSSISQSYMVASHNIMNKFSKQKLNKRNMTTLDTSYA